MTLIIGIDVGKSGGVAWQSTLHERRHAEAKSFSATETDTAWLFRDIQQSVDEEIIAYIERVGATPQMGVSSAFTFGRGYGFLRGILIGLGIPFEEVSPVKWQSAFGLRQGKKLAQGDTEKHNAIKGKAQQLFPHLQITHAKAAALLICEWGRRQYEPITDRKAV